MKAMTNTHKTNTTPQTHKTTRARITVEAALAQLGQGWHGVDERQAIAKTYRFATFAAAWAWMTHVALIAEKMNHHPEWLNVYRTVKVVLTTFDTGGLSHLDVALAQAMDAAAGQPGAAPRGTV